MRKFLFFTAFAALSVLSCSDDMPCVTCENSSSSGSNNSCDIKDYKTVKINDQKWMAQNLNCYFPYSKCYGNEPENCAKYGRLYDKTMAMMACPEGWHLPSAAEWSELISYVEITEDCNICAGKHLKSKNGWNGNGSGLDTYDFSAMPGGGYYVSEGFFGIGNEALWWSADDDDSDTDKGQGININSIDMVSTVYTDKNSLLSVRCLQDQDIF